MLKIIKYITIIVVCIVTYDVIVNAPKPLIIPQDITVKPSITAEEKPTTFVPSVKKDAKEEKKQLVKKESVTGIPPIIDKRLNTGLLYKASWKGIDVAKMKVFIKPVDQGDDLFSDISVFIRTRGLLKAITKFKSNTESLVAYKDDKYHPQTYKTYVKGRKNDRNITLKYSANGDKITSETNVPPEKRWKRKEVPVELKNNTVDPLTLVLRARNKVMKLYQQGNFDKDVVIPVYNGRRRSDYIFDISNIKHDNLIHVNMREKAVSGYTNNELKELNEGQYVIEFYLDPDSFIPIKALGLSEFGNAVVRLDGFCDNIKMEC